MKRILSLITFGLCLGFSPLFAQKKNKKGTANPPTTQNDRQFWLAKMDQMVRPVMYYLAQDSLRIMMPKVTSKRIDNREHRIQVQYVEVLGRVLSGIAPWLQGEGGSAEEVALRNQYRAWALKGISNALDSTAKDYMTFNIGGQQIVDASYLAYAFLRAPWLFEHLSKTDQDRLAKALRTTRQFKPVFSNWLLFSALTETFFCRFGYEWDPMRVDYALQQLEQWYVGDGMYNDGTTFAYDYYNSYVIHPYLAAITQVIGQKTGSYNGMIAKIKKRNERYAVIQERLINTDGTYPATGRSIVYRGAAFHHLADMAWRKALPATLKPAQVRCALTAVIRKTLESPSTYEKGWLTIGLYGSQPDLADFYNNQGSLYIASNIFLPLGLPENDPFWKDAPEKWSAQKIWSGEDFPHDHSESWK
ncbi:hypothetical protein BWI96_07130 [Siphonobacter sp. SORGH_AS_0500]|uniref:DUF2264 domain-containing protein n=1 Tax=Siphonobacter sp. SORGH_AS_0500 TaxID=1864824 RepID=UPI000CC4AF7C|nr:DUF2264 domain-containing protein [Siphonobacter sp. SORGH_AS_0500]PKK37298.1 hypothetical protein BWI96_07130 [Siphonobacter sp. SORGH_AS_0500]